MPYSATTATRKIQALSRRIRVIAGGTSASKTVSTLLVLIDKAQRDKVPTLTSIVSESFPHLRRGVMRDFLLIMQEHNYFKDSNWSRTDFTYTFETGSQIEFFSVDQPGKVRGPRRDRLFINEANNVPYEAFDQLEVRTKECIYIDFNPVSEFWFYTELKDKRDDVEFITLTYKDNEALSSQIVASIEQRRHNASWWRVYGEGQLGEVEGRVFTGWRIVDEVPFEARLERRGLDFGFSADPAAIVDVHYMDGGFILDEQMYLLGQSNRNIADFLLPLPACLTVADSAEPKSIAEIQSYGVKLIGASKGPGSREQGIRYLQDQKISVTKRSVNLIREYRNFLWDTDRKTGKMIRETVGEDHCLDAVRYGLDGKWRKPTASAQFIPDHAARAQSPLKKVTTQFVPAFRR